MILFVSPRLVAIFLGVLRARVALAAMFAMLAAAGVYGALRIPTDSASIAWWWPAIPSRRPRPSSSGCSRRANRR